MRQRVCVGLSRCKLRLYSSKQTENQIQFPKKKRRLDAVYIANFKKRETFITNVKNMKLYVFENIYMLILFLIQENVLQRSAQGKQRLKKF